MYYFSLIQLLLCSEWSVGVREYGTNGQTCPKDSRRNDKSNKNKIRRNMGWFRVDYKVCSMMIKGRIRKRINLETFYPLLQERYPAEYDPEITNRVIVHLAEASIMFFASGTIQIYLKDPNKKEETIEEANRMLGLLYPTFSAEF